MPSASTLAAFAAAAFVLIAVPGPNMIYLVARSLSEGRRAGLLSALGIETGTLVHTAAAAVGLSAVLASSATAFAVVKYLGAAYLVYLGLRALLGRGEGHAADAPPVSGRHVYRQALLTQVLNPKVAILFLASFRSSSTPTGRRRRRSSSWAPRSSSWGWRSAHSPRWPPARCPSACGRAAPAAARGGGGRAARSTSRSARTPRSAPGTGRGRRTSTCRPRGERIARCRWLAGD